MIIKTELFGGYVWIEHDDSVGVEGRIFVLHTQAPGHASFAMGSHLARLVGQELVRLTEKQYGISMIDHMHKIMAAFPTDHERVERWLAEHGRLTNTTVSSEGSTLTDGGTIFRGRRSTRPVVFTFDTKGMLIRISRLWKAWWLLRGSGIEVWHVRG
jgi:hypothetical protein